MSFEPRYAIVTASDSGIGKATAVALANDGMDVGITWHSDSDGAEATAEEVGTAGQKAYVAQLGGLDVFVNNAGMGAANLLLDTSYDDWRKIVAVDLDGAFICLQRAARRMVSADAGGRLIAVTSVHEHQPRVGSGAYDAAKHGLGGLMKTFALELGRYEITANSVAPGEISTPMTGQEDEDPTAQERPGIPLRRPGDAREIAAVIAFLASPQAGYVNGASWVVDGGMLQMGPQGGSHIESDDWRAP